MDYEYWLRLGKSGVRFSFLEEKLAGSRLYADNKTLGARVKVHKEINDMFKIKFGLVPDRWLFNYAHVVIESKLDKNKKPRIFMFLLSCLSIISSLRWNMTISSSMLKCLLKWYKALILQG